MVLKKFKIRTLWEFGECVSKADRRYRCFLSFAEIKSFQRKETVVKGKNLYFAI